MQLIPVIYLKEGRAVLPAGTKPPWFNESPQILAEALVGLGAEGLFIHDLNIPVTGKSPNFGAIRALRARTKLPLWVSGNFRSHLSVNDYVDAGINKVVLSAVAYQVPGFARTAVEKFFKAVSVKIEVKNGHMVIPGLIAPTRKSAVDYGKQFASEGVTHLCIADTDPQGFMGQEHFRRVREFCAGVEAAVLSLGDLRKMEDMKPLFDCESSGLMGTAFAKSLYGNLIDLRSCRGYINDLAAAVSLEETLSPE